MKASHRHTERAIHLVPDALAVLAPVDFITEPNPGGSVALTQIKDGDYNGAMNTMMQNMSVQGLKGPAVLLIAAWVAKVVGRKLGLNKIGSKKVKVF